MITDLDDVWRTNGDGEDAVRARRLYRLEVVLAGGASYAIDSAFLALFASAGLISAFVPVAFATAGVLHVVIFGLLHWSGLSERAGNPHLSEWQMTYAILVQLAGIVLAPVLAVYFLALIFIVFGFAMLRLRIRSALLAWLLTCLAIGYLLVDVRVAMTNTLNATTFLAVTTWAAYASVLLRCILLGYYVSALRFRIFRDNLQLADDLAQGKRVEAELERQRRQLEEIAEERALALAVAKEAAEAASRAKSAFLATVSHELRTPMHIIMGMNDLARQRATDAKQIECLGKVSEASGRLLTLIDDIINVSRLETGGMTLEERTFSVAEVVDDAVRSQRADADAKGLSISTEVGSDVPPTVRGDPQRLRQILVSFISNAVKFSDRGQITVRAYAAAMDATALLLRLEVADQGIGVSADKQARLFHLFAQGDDSATRKYSGVGLGLIIAKRLAERMGGEVGVRSREGVGSTFWATMRMQLRSAEGN